MQEENLDEIVIDTLLEDEGPWRCVASIEAQINFHLQIELRMRIYSTEHTAQPCGRAAGKDRVIDDLKMETYQTV